jgi:hypothetical protein
MMENNTDFRRDGSLRSNILFSFCGEISQVSIKKYVRYRNNRQTEGEIEKESYYIEIVDRFGFSCSFFKAGMSQESAYAHAAKIPYGQTLCIEGRVKVTRGRTYFDAKNITFPDGDQVFVWTLEEGEEYQNEGAGTEK